MRRVPSRTPLSIVFALVRGSPAAAMLVGLIVGLAATAVALGGRTDDRLVETAVTVLAAFGSLLVAEHFHVSGVLA